MTRLQYTVYAVVVAFGVCCSSTTQNTAPAATGAQSEAAEKDPLPSWNEGAAKAAIQRFVVRVSRPGPDYVAPHERVAVFDNDGTLWPEQPVPTQLQFTADRAKALVAVDPAQGEQPSIKALLNRDWKALTARGEAGMQEVLAAIYAGMTTQEFDSMVMSWIDTARDPRFGRRYPELSYQPMLELLAYLRANGFKVFIVSGGGADFMRPWTEDVYGVPPEQVVGSRIKLQYENQTGEPALRRLPEIDFIDDRAGKPVGIQQLIGRQPIAAFGNSDGDFEMLEWTTSGPGVRFAMIVHHTDAVREWAYDREAHSGKLSYALDVATSRAWTVVDMKRDWGRVYAFQN